MAQKPMTDEELTTLVKNLVRDCEAYRDERSVTRVRANEYYDGVMRDAPADEGRSRVVSRDVRSAIKKVKPSIIRTILGNDEVVEYMPIADGDEKSAQQASDYVNYVVIPESRVRRHIEDVVDDALKLRNGILKWYWEKKAKVSVSRHSGLTEDEYQVLLSDDDVEAMEHSTSEEMMDGPEGPQPIVLHDVKIKRTQTDGRVVVSNVQPENFLIHPDAVDFDTAPILGESTRYRRSDLVALGYDRALVDKMPKLGASRDMDNEDDSRRDDVTTGSDDEPMAMQEVEYYDLLVRVDVDNDGIAELRRIVYAGAIDAKYLLENEEWDEVNYCDVTAERRPHQWEGTSITDDVSEIQKIKTVLLRQTMDNLYWSNNPQPVVDEDAIANPEGLLNPAFGLPIRIKSGRDATAAIRWNVVPFIAEKSFGMLEYLDNEITDRTGISDASSGMAPDALQNMTAKASAMIEQAGIGQTELMVRTIAESLKPMFRGVLKLVIQHQDKPRTVRLRDQWVTYDPRTWNAGMDATVNTGLGAGTRERDMMMMQTILMLQEKLLAAFGPGNNPFVTPDNLHNSITKQAEAAGLRSPSLYFTKPDPQQIQQMMEAQSKQPSPEEVKAKAQMELEKFKAQIQSQTDEKKMQVDASKEKAQMEADLVVKNAEMQKDSALAAQEIASQERLKIMDIEWQREKLALELAAQERERQQDREFQAKQSEQQRNSDIQKAQASSIGKAFENNERAVAQ